MRSAFMVLIFVVAAFSPPASAVVTIDWVTVGGPGNACYVQPQGCFGSVAGPYLISRFEVTNDQYSEFLNAVAVTDTNQLYNTNMMGTSSGGIARGGFSGNYSYSPITGRENLPVNFVSFWDATRFANWLHNGQPTGIQDNTTTEDGAYTLTPTGIANNTVARNVGADTYITSEDEWYKAAYYNTSTMIYTGFPAGSNIAITCVPPSAAGNTANCNGVGNVTDVGSYTGSASPSGTFDQGGNVWEWNESILGASNRGIRGAAFNSGSNDTAAIVQGTTSASNEADGIGFRIAGRWSVGVNCGNGMIEFGEQCDDGDLDTGDGCDQLCGIETGFGCAGEPSVCTAAELVSANFRLRGFSVNSGGISQSFSSSPSPAIGNAGSSVGQPEAVGFSGSYSNLTTSISGFWSIVARILPTLDFDGDLIPDFLDDDDDNDGLLDSFETGSGVFVSEVDTGTNPLNADTDGDGYDDGNEVSAGSNPLDAGSTPMVVQPVPGLSDFGLIALAALILAFAGMALRSRPVDREGA